MYNTDILYNVLGFFENEWTFMKDLFATCPSPAGLFFSKSAKFGVGFSLIDSHLVGGLEHVLFSIIYGIILPID